MQKLFVLLLSFTMLFTSSCMMKNILWDFLDAEGPIAAKALTSTPDDRLGVSAAFLESCATMTGSLSDEFPKITVASVKVLLLLFFALIILPWAFSRIREEKRRLSALFPYFLSNPVPIYLKLGRLIYYS